jgi:hypothetical protein
MVTLRCMRSLHFLIVLRVLHALLSKKILAWHTAADDWQTTTLVPMDASAGLYIHEMAPLGLHAGKLQMGTSQQRRGQVHGTIKV